MSNLEAENRLLREMLWLRHGCPFPALYHDDGEMQCNVCMIDFKRDSAESIRERFHKINEPKVKAFFAKEKERKEL